MSKYANYPYTKDPLVKGFSLIEMLAGVAIIGIITAVAIPSFNNLIADSRLNSLESDMSSTIYRAVAESRKQRKRLVICPRQSDTSCGTDWNNGWILFTDDSLSGTDFDLDPAEDIIRVVGEPTNDDTSINITTRAFSSSTTQASRLSIEPRGRSPSVTIVLCDHRGISKAKSMAIFTSGLVSDDLSESGNGSTIDLWGDPIQCE